MAERYWDVVVGFGGHRCYRVWAKTKTEACNLVDARHPSVRLVGEGGAYQSKAKFAVPVEFSEDRPNG